MKGLDRALRRMQQLEKNAQSALQIAVGKAGEEALQSARMYAPVRTGALKNSLALQRQGLQACLITPCPYAAAVEMGALHTPAQPFMMPAARQSDYFQRAAQCLKERMK